MAHSNTYSIAQYEKVRALALDLIERNMNAQLDIDNFLDAVKAWIFSTAATREKAHRTGKLHPPHERLLMHYEHKMLNILNGCSTGTLGFMTNLVEDLKQMTKESLDEF